jgi:NAD(P)-dependent dehydrogenase (short-subunit alcohol dehydrogenase family)
MNYRRALHNSSKVQQATTRSIVHCARFHSRKISLYLSHFTGERSMKESLQNKVVVITGASSGIGRAAAMDFAKQGATVVLAGRHTEALQEAEAEAKGHGAQSMSVTTDVTKEDQVEQLASQAEEAYGKIDVWVNNAGVALFAKFEDTPSDDYRRVIDTDFFGYVYGARAALKRFKNQGYGTLINVDSIEGITPRPYQSAYAAAKHAVRALASSLRMELALDGAENIHVCTVLPASVDTPMFAHAGNYTGRTVTASDRAIAPAQVAKAITGLAIKPQREVIVGQAAGNVMSYLFKPASYERKEAFGFDKRHLTSDQTSRAQGNLFQSTGPHAVDGGWRSKQQKQKAEQSKPWLPWAIAGGAILGLTGLAALTMMLTGDKKGKNKQKQSKLPEKLKSKGLALIPVLMK